MEELEFDLDFRKTLAADLQIAWLCFGVFLTAGFVGFLSKGEIALSLISLLAGAACFAVVARYHRTRHRMRITISDGIFEFTDGNGHVRSYPLSELLVAGSNGFFVWFRFQAGIVRIARPHLESRFAVQVWVPRSEGWGLYGYLKDLVDSRNRAAAEPPTSTSFPYDFDNRSKPF